VETALNQIVWHSSESAHLSDGCIWLKRMEISINFDKCCPAVLKFIGNNQVP